MKFLFLGASVCPAQERILWRDPGDVARIDFKYPAGGRANMPSPPFAFVSEEGGGTSPKVLVRDKQGKEWRMKAGYEVNSESFATRFVAALGYFAEPNVFISHGKASGVQALKRASGMFGPDGSFGHVVLELRDPKSKFLEDDWAYNDNPFVGTKQLNGLKVLIMLLSNWDNKDVRNRKDGSNTSIVERRTGERVERIYFVNDWGQTLGAWGAEMKPKGWDCKEYTEQTPSFVLGQTAGKVHFGFVGQHTNLFKGDIEVADVRWLLGYLDRVTNVQLLDGLRASGADLPLAKCFAGAIQARVDQLRVVAGMKK